MIKVDVIDSVKLPPLEDYVKHIFGMPSRLDIVNLPKYTMLFVWVETKSEVGSVKTAVLVKRFLDTVVAQYPKRKDEILNHVCISLFPGMIDDRTVFISNFNKNLHDNSWNPSSSFNLGDITVQDPKAVAYSGSNRLERNYSINQVRAK